MGHWNVNCAITHLPIGSDRCVAIWTKPRKYDDGYMGMNAITPFYRGTYDTYGRIDIDKKEKYQELITEKMRDEPSMFILESVFDALDTFAVGKWGDTINKGSAYENSNIYSYCLELLGFVKQEKESGDIRYKYVYKHSSEPNKEVWSDEQWIKINDGKKKYESIHYWKEFEKHYPNVDYTILHNTWSELLELEREYNKQKELNDFIGGVRKQLPKKDKESIYNIRNEIFCERFGISEEMFPYLVNEDFRKAVAKIMRVNHFMYANNLKFGYRFHGSPQEGNLQAAIKLHAMMGKAIKTKQKKIKNEIH